MRSVSKEFVDRQLPWLDAAIKVLSDAKQPLDCEQIADLIQKMNLRFSLGPYPGNTVASVLNTSIFFEGDASPVRRVSGNKFSLRNDAYSCRRGSSPISFPHLESGKPALFEACGLNWMRNKVLWGQVTSLLGRDSSQTVKDFSNYSGVYALYEGFDFVFAGWADSGNLGNTLYLHTLDHLAARWDAFSWFGTSVLIN